MVEINEKQAFSLIQKAKETGSVRAGINEVTKAIERGVAKAVFYANDVSPAEIVAHLDDLCKEMNIICAKIGTKAELGAAVQIKSTTAVAIIDAGSGKKELDALYKELNDEKLSAKSKTEEVKEEEEKDSETNEGAGKEAEAKESSDEESSSSAEEKKEE